MDEKDKLLFKYGKDRYFLVTSAHLSIYRVTKKKKPYTVISCGDTSLENVHMLGGHCTNTVYGSSLIFAGKMLAMIRGIYATLDCSPIR